MKAVKIQKTAGILMNSSPKAKSVIIFTLILLCSFMYYNSGNYKRLRNNREKMFETQISNLEKKNEIINSLNEQLLIEIDIMQDSIQLIKAKKEIITIKYAEKYKKISKFSNHDIANEFKAIFADSIR